MSYQERKKILIKKEQQRKEQQIQEFLLKINKVINNLDSIVIPSIQTTKEYEAKYICYHIAVHPNLLAYQITIMRKEYPFDIYYSKSYYNFNVPKKYKKEFEELKKHLEK